MTLILCHKNNVVREVQVWPGFVPRPFRNPRYTDYGVRVDEYEFVGRVDIDKALYQYRTTEYGPDGLGNVI